jgi:hypothetical protein
MLSLRYSFTSVRTRLKPITLDNRHALKMLCKHPASQQTSHTCADHHSVLTAQAALLSLPASWFQYDSYPFFFALWSTHLV